MNRLKVLYYRYIRVNWVDVVAQIKLPKPGGLPQAPTRLVKVDKVHFAEVYSKGPDLIIYEHFGVWPIESFQIPHLPISKNAKVQKDDFG